MTRPNKRFGSNARCVMRGWGIPYLYVAEDYGRASTEAKRRAPLLTVDDGEPIEVEVPDTGWRDLF